MEDNTIFGTNIYPRVFSLYYHYHFTPINYVLHLHNPENPLLQGLPLTTPPKAPFDHYPHFTKWPEPEVSLTASSCSSSRKAAIAGLPTVKIFFPSIKNKMSIHTHNLLHRQEVLSGFQHDVHDDEPSLAVCLLQFLTGRTEYECQMLT